MCVYSCNRFHGLISFSLFDMCTKTLQISIKRLLLGKIALVCNEMCGLYLNFSYAYPPVMTDTISEYCHGMF